MIIFKLIVSLGCRMYKHLFEQGHEKDSFQNKTKKHPFTCEHTSLHCYKVVIIIIQ